MAVKIKFDNSHNVINPTFVLSTKSGKKLGVLPVHNIEITDNFNSYFDLTFKVYKTNNGKKCSLWDKITDFKLVWCREWDVWFEIYVDTQEDNSVVKHIEARSLGEAELSQIMLYDIHINEDGDSNWDSNNTEFKSTVLYNEDDPTISLVDRLLEKAPHYSVAHVDSSIKNIQRTFSFDGTNIYDALQEVAEEIGCIVIINCGSNADGSIARTISIYDLESYCLDCGHRDEFTGVCPKCGSDNILTGYGEDTNIFVSTENLADEISFSTDVDSVKNCFRLEAGDDLMTATIINCNPNGSAYIIHIPDDLKQDMSDELQAKIDQYNADYNKYYNTHEITFDKDILSKYNALVEKYQEYDDELKTIESPIVGYSKLMNAYYDTIDLYLFLKSSFMPSPELSDTTAALQAEKLTAVALSPVAVQDISKCSSATASSTVLSVAKVLVDSHYQVKVKNGVLNGSVWSGNFVITNYSDEEDTAESKQIQITITDNSEVYLKQTIEKQLNNSTDDANDIISLFALEYNDFVAEIKKYCLSSLTTFHDSCQACLDILIEQGVSNNETWADKDPNLYNSLYVPYYNKLLALQDEIQVREEEIAIVIGSFDKDGNIVSSGLQTLVEEEKNKIQDALNFEEYLGEKLWLEFISYRREDTYTNDSYISDGLSNSELFKYALEFIETAQKEIYKSATLQHSIEATLKNLLVMKEFQPIVDYFSVGNWIRVRVDDQIYRLRLLSYHIDFDNLDNISIEFSDVKQIKNCVTDAESIAKQVASIGGTYKSVARQSSQGAKSQQTLQQWDDSGLQVTNTKIIGGSDEQSQVWDSHGMLFRKYNSDTDTYDDVQLKIINSTMAITNDNWRTTKTAIGQFYYRDPKTNEIVSAYGINGEVLVGRLIVGEGLGIYNSSGNLTFDDNGLTVTNGVNTVIINPNDAGSIFSISNVENENLLFVNNDGDLVVIGNITAKNLTLLDGATVEGSKVSGLSEVAISGDYEDLINKPEIPDISEVLKTPLNDDEGTVGQYLSKATNGSEWKSADTTVTAGSESPVSGNAVFEYALTKNFGVENAGKFLHINDDGSVHVVSPDELVALLEFVPLTEEDIDEIMEG